MCADAAHEQMEPVGDLHGLRCTRTGTLGVGAGAVAADDLDLGMLLEPGTQRRRLAVGQQVDDFMAFQIDEDGAVAQQTILRKPRWNGR
jgi:hypothetical protein